MYVGIGDAENAGSGWGRASDGLVGVRGHFRSRRREGLWVGVGSSRFYHHGNRIEIAWCAWIVPLVYVLWTEECGMY